MKKLITLVLALAMLVSCFAVVTAAAAPQGNFASDEGVLPFEDVKDSHWFTPYLKFCYANGIIKGMTEYTFGHAGQLTRAQFVMMLANLEGIDTSAYTVTKFTDVKSNHWYYGAVAWAYENGIVNGMTDTTFVPNGVLTRAQLATVMRNYMKDKYTVEVDDSVLDKFSDKPKAEYWYYEAMKYAVSAGLLSGMSNGTLSSTGNVTRAQAAVIFDAFMKNYYYASCEHSFTDADCTNSSVCTACGMKQGLPNGHRVTAYDCVTSATCLTCDATVEPSKIIHTFDAATCTKPRTCRLCGETRGDKKAHSFSAANCYLPKICINCGATEGKELGHTTTNGICGRCGKDCFSNSYDRVIHYVKTKGQYDSATNCYAYAVTGDYSATCIAYYPANGLITIENLYVFDSVDYDVTQIDINRYGSVYSYYYQYSADNTPVFYGEGKLDAATFTQNTVEGFSNYEIAPGFSFTSTLTENMNDALQEMIYDADYILEILYGGTIKDLGFNKY